LGIRSKKIEEGGKKKKTSVFYNTLYYCVNIGNNNLVGGRRKESEIRIITVVYKLLEIMLHDEYALCVERSMIFLRWKSNNNLFFGTLL